MNKKLQSKTKQGVEKKTGSKAYSYEIQTSFIQIQKKGDFSAFQRKKLNINKRVELNLNKN